MFKQNMFKTYCKKQISIVFDELWCNIIM